MRLMVSQLRDTIAKADREKSVLLDLANKRDKDKEEMEVASKVSQQREKALSEELKMSNDALAQTNEALAKAKEELGRVEDLSREVEQKNQRIQDLSMEVMVRTHVCRSTSISVSSRLLFLNNPTFNNPHDTTSQLSLQL